MRKGILIGLLLSLLIVLAACTGTQEKLKFGVMAPLSGDAAVYGNPISNGYIMAVDEINAAGGIDGRQVELIFEDSKCTPNDGATAAQKLVSVDQVKVIFGEVCSGATLASIPITEAAQVILISPSATSPQITSAGDFVFRTAPSDSNAGRIAADKAYEMNYRKVAIISETSDYAQGLRETFRNVFTTAGGEVVADETYTTDTTDFRTLLLKVKEENPDVIYLAPQTVAKGALVLKQLKEAGMNLQVFTSESMMSDSLVAENSEDMEGVIGVEPSFNPENPKSAEFAARYKTRFGKDLEFPSYQAGAYDALYLVKEAIESNDGVADTTKIRDFLYSVEDWDGAIGKLTIDENGDPRLNYVVKKAQGGRTVVLDTAS